MKSLVLFLVAAAVANQVLGEGVEVAGEGVTITTVRRGANAGLLGGRKYKCTPPDPVKATFGWAATRLLIPPGSSPNTGGSATGGTSIGQSGNVCYDVCGLGYRLQAVSSPIPTEPPFPSGPPPPPGKDVPFLCRFSYKSTKQPTVTRFLFGYYTQNLAVCRAYSPEDGTVVTRAPDADIPGFECGCCGLINRDGFRWGRGCTTVTAVTPNKETTCPAGRTWTPPASPTGALPGTDICLRAQGAGKPALWGTIVPPGVFVPPPGGAPGLCYVANPDTAKTDQLPPPVNANSPFQRFCYKINPYSGPPTPDCKNKNNP